MKDKTQRLIKTIIFIVVLLIPIIYSFFYLKSYWDPYGNLQDMKIAVVNLDDGNETENEGKEFVNELKEDGTFSICDVTLDEANEGLKEGTYYAMIMLPKDFTESLNSAKEENKRISTITYTPNKQTNYLATQIINSAIKTIEANLQAKVAEKVVDNLTEKLNEVPDSLQEISDGTGKIVNGAQDLNDGLKKIDDGVGTLSSSYSQFNDGVDSAFQGSQSVSNGMTQVDNGINTLKSGGVSLDSAIGQINEGTEKLLANSSQGLINLQDGINALNEGAQNLDNGVSSYVDGTKNLSKGVVSYIQGTQSLTSGMNDYIDGVNTLNQNVNQILAGIVAYGNANPTALKDPNIAKLYGGAAKILEKDANGKTAMDKLSIAGAQIKAGGENLNKNNDTLTGGAQALISKSEELKQGSNSLKGGTTELALKSADLTQITDGVKQLQEATSKVKEGTTSLNGGIDSLKDGTNQLRNGSNNLTDGLSKLKTSSDEVENALNTLEGGVDSAYEGSSKLTDGVKTLKENVDEGIKTAKTDLQKLNGLSSFVENPVEFKEESYGKIDSYGIAFTPLFLCIGLWVGSLMCYVVLYYDQKNRFGIFGSDAKNKILQNIIYIGIGAVQGIVTGLLLKVGLGFSIESAIAYYGSCILIGIVFMSIIQFLIRNFGDIGKFIALIVLVLQLAASGGTFPVETIEKGFRAWNPVLPMTYTIKLLREILVPTNANHIGMYIGVLFVIMIISFSATTIVDIIRKKKNASN